jgi:hypothetical protein
MIGLLIGCQIEKNSVKIISFTNNKLKDILLSCIN